MSSIKIICNEGKELAVGMDIVKLSPFLLKALERDPDSASISIPDLEASVIESVLEYIRLTQTQPPKEIPEVLKTSNLKAELDDNLYFEFINKVDYEGAFNLINAALLFELLHLHDLACAKIASFMKGKTMEDINKEFTIECQLTSEDAKTIGLEVEEQA